MDQLSTDINSMKGKIDDLPTKNYLSLWRAGMLFVVLLAVFIQLLMLNVGT